MPQRPQRDAAAAAAYADEFARSGDVPTTRVKMLWTEAKGEASGSRSKKKQPPPPPPRSIQKRDPTATPEVPAPLPVKDRIVESPLPTQLPLPPLLPPSPPRSPTDPHEELVERLQACETALSTGSLSGGGAGGVILPPTYSAKRGADASALSAAFRDACAAIIKTYPPSASTMSIDKRLWMSWYKEISSLRGALRSAAPPSKAATMAAKLQRVLAATAAFYSDLADALQKRLGEHDADADDDADAARASLHLCLVALGDIARYAQKASPGARAPDWTLAQQRYEAALCVLPSNGKVYNQLAFLAISQHEALRAVYLFARSQACETPFLSRDNLVQALARGNAKKDVDAHARGSDDAVTDVQDRVETLFLSALATLFKTKASSREFSFQARGNTLLGGLAVYLGTRTAMLFAGEPVDLDAVRTVLSQCVCVVIFLVHDFQPRAGSSSDRPMSRAAFTEEAVGWRETANVRRLLGLGFSLVASVMKECAKAVEAPAYMVIAKDLLNTLLPPISIFLRWLQLHPWLLQPAAATNDFVRATAKFLHAVATSLLADRVLDEDLARMGAKLLPEDRELVGFLPLESGPSVETREAREAKCDNTDDDVLLDIRLCRVLSFREGFAKLEQTLAVPKTAETETALQREQDELAADASCLELLAGDADDSPTSASESDEISNDSSSRDVSSDVQTVAPEEEDNDGDDGDGDDDEEEEEKEEVAAAAGTAADISAMPPRKSGGARARRKAGAKQRSPPPDHCESHEESLGFAAVMAIGADKKLFDASRAPPSAAVAATERKCLIVIDAANVAMRHGQHRKFSCTGIRMACDYYLQRGHRVVGFLPDFLLDSEQVAARKRLASAGTDVPATKLPDDVPLLQKMVDDGVLVPTPSQDYDDSYCIQYAGMYDGCVVTNDMYRDHVEGMNGPRERKAAMRMWLVAHLISFTWVRNDFLPNPNFRYPKPARL
ncbi:hypothetical protein PybrP1_009075 [[Pythium] brassicae (nom. inval.)]|nr:hypothetical protein PybrP1_009075 [[Pythium] brassicae (nom. inval.)]